MINILFSLWYCFPRRLFYFCMRHSLALPSPAIMTLSSFSFPLHTYFMYVCCICCMLYVCMYVCVTCVCMYVCVNAPLNEGKKIGQDGKQT